MSKKKQSKRLIHIDLLNKTLNAQSENITSEQLSSVNKVIQILGFITNAEYSNMYKIYGREEDDQFFADLTEFLIHDDKWQNITNKRREEYDKLKKHLHDTKDQDLKIDKYLFLIDFYPFREDHIDHHLNTKYHPLPSIFHHLYYHKVIQKQFLPLH